MFNFLWPLILIIVANIVYQICAKSIPEDMDAMASMVVTYVVGAICSVIMFFVMNKDSTLMAEYGKVNWAPIALGVSVVGLEVGFIYAYKAGWQVSMLSIVQSSVLAVALLGVGALLYHEALTWNKVIGMVICLVGLAVINR